jgi:hypothetical protein
MTCLKFVPATLSLCITEEIQGILTVAQILVVLFDI